MQGVEAQDESGSPPRVWGRPIYQSRQTFGNRFTPTRVGTTFCGSRLQACAPVHPHACGDDASSVTIRRVRCGSPPRVWGRLSFDSLRPMMNLDGSPPRVWGRRLAFYVRLLRSRFTPTRVGTTVWVSVVSAASAVHPHACGDDAPDHICGRPIPGSPPRVWGRLRRKSSNCSRAFGSPPRVWGRLTVAANNVVICTVHPHACGDDARSPSAMVQRSGSPPRVWGRRDRAPAALAIARFTPTRVGTTCRRFVASTTPPVHPHACGDDAKRLGITTVERGSPPRVWGRRFCISTG